MASIGDLVMRMTLDHSQFISAITDIRSQNQALEQQLNRSSWAHEAVASSIALEEREILQSIAAKRLMQAQMEDEEHQRIVLDRTVVKAKENLVALTKANDEYERSLNSAGAMSVRYATQMEQMRGSIQKTREESVMAASAMNDPAFLQQHLTGAIVTADRDNNIAQLNTAKMKVEFNDARLQALRLDNVIRQVTNSQLSMANAERIVAQAMAHFTQNTKMSRRELLELEQQIRIATGATQQMQGSMTRHNVAISNAIFLVEDAASVYGTQGLAGALRAASNNMTMIAMTMGGPYVAAATVAIVATMQLVMAFTKIGEKTKYAKDESDKYLDSLRKITDEIKRQVAFDQEVQNFDTSAEIDTAIQRKYAELESIQEQEDRIREEVNKNLVEADKARRNAESAISSIQTVSAGPGAAPAGLDAAIESEKRFLEEAEAADERAQQAGQRLVEFLKERETLERELNDLADRRVDIVEGEMKMAEERNQAEKAWNEGQNIAENRRLDEEHAKRLLALRKQIQDTMDPKGSANRGIAETLSNRIAEAQAIGAGGEMDSIIEAALADMRRNMERFENRGPSAMQRGSREQLEMERQMMLQATAPKEETPDLLKKLIEQINGLKGINKDQKEATLKVVEAFSGQKGVMD